MTYICTCDVIMSGDFDVIMSNGNDEEKFEVIGGKETLCNGHLLSVWLSCCNPWGSLAYTGIGQISVTRFFITSQKYD